MLDLIQIIMGVLILISPAEVPPVVTYVAMIWALVGGLGLITDALRLQRLSKVILGTPTPPGTGSIENQE